jgi:predicted CoA-binding protein
MSYAILANADRLKKHRHAWKAWRALKDFGCRTFLVAPDLERFEGSKVYPDLSSLHDKVDVVVPCLRSEYLKELVSSSAAIHAGYIWFQENNWTPELDEQCRKYGITAVRGCVLKHRIYQKPLAYVNPCYWHGRLETKVPDKYRLRGWK